MKVNKMSFIKLALFSALIFLVIVLIIEILYSLTGKNSIDQIITTMTQTNYMIKKGVSALIYGTIMAYFMKKKANSIKNK